MERIQPFEERIQLLENENEGEGVHQHPQHRVMDECPLVLSVSGWQQRTGFDQGAGNRSLWVA